MTRRLLLSYLTVTAVVLLLLEVPLAVFYSQRQLERFTAGVDRDASIIATIYEEDLEQSRPLDPVPAQLYKQRTGARVVVVDTQGVSAFTALRRKNVPARLLWFPDENHWVLKPQNSQRWHAEVLSWIDRYTGHTPPKAK